MILSTWSHNIPWQWTDTLVAAARTSLPETRYTLNKLAKKGTRLPVPSGKPQEAWSIFVVGGEAPTPAKKWIHQLYQIERRTTTHWVSWLPLKWVRQRVWRPWLWGQMQWT